MPIRHAILLILILTGGAFAEPPANAPPFERLLQGEDAKKAEQLKQRITDLEAADKYDDAIQVAEELLDFRRRMQGEDHYQVVSGKWDARVRKKVADLPPDQRMAWRGAVQIAKRADQLDEAGRGGEALVLHRKFLEECRRILGDDLPPTGVACEAIAHRLTEQGKYAEAEPLARKAVEVWQKTLGPDHPETAHGMAGVAVILSGTGRRLEAEPLARKALDIMLKDLGDKHHATAQAYSALAENLRAQGRHADAEPLYRNALAIYQKLVGDQSHATAHAYVNLALNLSAQARADEGEPLARKGLEIYKQVLGDNHPATATTYANLAAIMNVQARYHDAEPLLRKALTILQQRLGENTNQTAGTYTLLATNLSEQGKYGEAEVIFRTALTIRQKLFGENHRETVASHANLAHCLNSQARYAEAEPIFRAVLAFFQRFAGEEHPDTGMSYSNVAFTLSAQGKYAEAEALYDRALLIRQVTVGEQHRDTATSYSNAANNLDAMGRHAEAEPWHRQALAIRRRVHGEDHPDTIKAYVNLALNLDALGRRQEGQPFLEKALAGARSRLGEYHPVTAATYNNVGRMAYGDGRFDDALVAVRRALDVWRQIHGDGHRDTAAAYVNVASTLHAMGRYDEAEAMARSVVASLETARLRITTSGLERATAAQRHEPRLRWAVALLRLGRVAEAWHALEGHCGRGLLDDFSANRVAVLSAAERKETETLSDQLNALDQRISTLVTAKGGLETRRAEFETLTKERSDVAAALERLATSLRQQEIYDWKTIQARLPEQGALVGWIDLPSPPNAVQPGGEHWALLLKASGAPVAVELAGSGKDGRWSTRDDDLPSAIGSSLREIKSLGSDQIAALYRQRCAPLEPHLRDVRHLIAMPSEAMRDVPLEILTDRFIVSYAPSGTMLARLVEKRRQTPELRRVLALGDPVTLPATPPRELPTPPDHGLMVTLVQPAGNGAAGGMRPRDLLLQYGDKQLRTRADLKVVTQGEEVPVRIWRDGQTLDLKVKPGQLGVGLSSTPGPQALLSARQADQKLALARRGGTFDPLPGSRYEVHAIARLFREADRLLGPDASRAKVTALEKDLGRYDVVHLATHGMVNDQVALESAILLSQSEQDNGRLTAGYVKDHWPLRAELVVLSACESGLGRKANGEGYVGFTQALFLAGARSVVLSQWQVSDAATSLLMTRFYENLLGKRAGLNQPMTKAEALREAKQWLRGVSRKEVEDRLAAHADLVRGFKLELPRRDANAPDDKPFAHPFYWSAFLLSGDVR